MSMFHCPSSAAEYMKRRLAGGVWECITNNLYDSRRFRAVGEKELSFFESVQGGPAITNMLQPAQLPGYTEFLLSDFEVDFLCDDENDRRNFYDSGALEFRIGARIYQTIAPLRKCKMRDELKAEPIIPILIPPYNNFAVRLIWQNLQPIKNDAVVFVRLVGGLYRQVMV
jgi:hypothetical protein